jgi:hypothetical protein
MEGLWFNDKTIRKMIIRNGQTLVGKAPTKQKRILMRCTMYLDGLGEDQLAGAPEWLGEARDFVMKSGEQVTASHVFKRVNVSMGDANLFKKKPNEAPNTQLDHFVIKQVGKADEKDTILTFEMRSGFSTDLWMWVGQQSGEEFDVMFEVIGQEADQFVEDEDASENEEDDASEGEDTPVEDVEDDETAIARHKENLLKM